jgi:hypothetical protein
MKLSVVLLAGAVALAMPQDVWAQGKGQNRDKKDDIPASSRPPAGMCRIWLDDVPAAQQPAPTDCATAVRNRPAKGRVIFGDDYVAPKRQDSTGGKDKPPVPVKGFAPPKPDSKKKPPFPVRIP